MINQIDQVTLITHISQCASNGISFHAFLYYQNLSQNWLTSISGFFGWSQEAGSTKTWQHLIFSKSSHLTDFGKKDLKWNCQSFQRGSLDKTSNVLLTLRSRKLLFSFFNWIFLLLSVTKDKTTMNKKGWKVYL